MYALIGHRIYAISLMAGYIRLLSTKKNMFFLWGCMNEPEQRGCNCTVLIPVFIINDAVAIIIRKAAS